MGPKKCTTLIQYIDLLKTTDLYSCGILLPENVSKRYINGNLTCDDLIESAYYKISSNIVCCVCAETLDQKQVKQYDDDVAKFSSVKPTCGSPDCGPFRTSRPRKVPLKRKRTAKPAKSVKKQRISPWVRGPKWPRKRRMNEACGGVIH